MLLLVSYVQQRVLLRVVNLDNVPLPWVLPSLHLVCQHPVMPPFHASDVRMLHPYKAPRATYILHTLASCSCSIGVYYNINWCFVAFVQRVLCLLVITLMPKYV